MRVYIGIIVYKSDMTLLLKNLTMLTKQSFTSDAGLDIRIVILDNDDGRQIPAIKNTVAEKLPALAGKFSYIGSENIGFGAGHNKIFEYVKGQTDFDYYLCANPDGIPHTEMLGEMVSFARKNNDRGIFEARQFPVEHPKVYDPLTGKTAWCSGCCLMFPKAVFERLGGFDEFFFMYMEDVDISWRAKLLGYDCYTVQDALFFHFVDESTRDVLKNMCISGYKLGCKYKDSGFKLYCLKKLSKLLNQEDMASLDRMVKGKSVEYQYFGTEKFMNFSSSFSFSTVRW